MVILHPYTCFGSKLCWLLSVEASRLQLKEAAWALEH